jgi:hypothetical protein
MPLVLLVPAGTGTGAGLALSFAPGLVNSGTAAVVGIFTNGVAGVWR